MNTTSYEHDKQYNEFKNSLTASVNSFWEELDSESQNVTDTEERKAQETYLSAKLKAAWEDIQSKYQSFLAYMKETFNIQEEDILKHKIQEMVHKAKKKGYILKASFLKELDTDLEDADDEKKEM